MISLTPFLDRGMKRKLDSASPAGTVAKMGKDGTATRNVFANSLKRAKKMEKTVKEENGHSIESMRAPGGPSTPTSKQAIRSVMGSSKIGALLSGQTPQTFAEDEREKHNQLEKNRRKRKKKSTKMNVDQGENHSIATASPTISMAKERSPSSATPMKPPVASSTTVTNAIQKDTIVRKGKDTVVRKEKNTVVREEKNTVVRKENDTVVRKENNTAVRKEKNTVDRKEKNTVVRTEKNTVVRKAPVESSDNSSDDEPTILRRVLQKDGVHSENGHEIRVNEEPPSSSLSMSPCEVASPSTVEVSTTFPIVKEKQKEENCENVTQMMPESQPSVKGKMKQRRRRSEGMNEEEKKEEDESVKEKEREDPCALSSLAPKLPATPAASEKASTTPISVTMRNKMRRLEKLKMELQVEEEDTVEVKKKKKKKREENGERESDDVCNAHESCETPTSRTIVPSPSFASETTPLSLTVQGKMKNKQTQEKREVTEEEEEKEVEERTIENEPKEDSTPVKSVEKKKKKKKRRTSEEMMETEKDNMDKEAYAKRQSTVVTEEVVNHCKDQGSMEMSSMEEGESVVDEESADSQKREERREEKRLRKKMKKEKEMSEQTDVPKVSTPARSTRSKKKEEDRKEEEKTEDIVNKEDYAKNDSLTDRLKPDLLGQVIFHMKDSHGLMVLRAVCAETRSLVDKQLRHMDSMLHLEEFDDGNAFIRDDMEQFWETTPMDEFAPQRGESPPIHSQLSSYLRMRALEKLLLDDMDGAMSQPCSVETSVDTTDLKQHPFKGIELSCIVHPSISSKKVRPLINAARTNELWLGRAQWDFLQSLPTLSAMERFEWREAKMGTFDYLPLAQMTELRLDLDDPSLTREALTDYLVSCVALQVLELNTFRTEVNEDGDMASLCSLFTRRVYQREEFDDDLEWMMPNAIEGEADPVTRCLPDLQNLSTNMGNVKIFWQLQNNTGLLEKLETIRIGSLTKTQELLTDAAYFTDTKESRRYKQPGFFSLQDAYKCTLESATLRVTARGGTASLGRDVRLIFDNLHELPPSLRRFSFSVFNPSYNGVCAPFKNGPSAPTTHPNRTTDHIGIEEMHLHFERAVDLRGLSFFLPSTLTQLSITINYDNGDEARQIHTLLPVLRLLGSALPKLNDLSVQIWGIRCLEPILSSIVSSSSLPKRLESLSISAYPVHDKIFESSCSSLRCLLLNSLHSLPSLKKLALHPVVLAHLVPEERRKGFTWRNGLAWLTNDLLGGSDKRMELEVATADTLPVLEDGEDYLIVPHWEETYDEGNLPSSSEDDDSDDEREESRIYHGDEDFITDDEEEPVQEHPGDGLDEMEKELEEETEKIERREERRSARFLAAGLDSSGNVEGEEEEGDIIDFDSLSDMHDDGEEEMERNAFVDDEAMEASGSGDGEEGEDEEERMKRKKREESPDSECSSDDDANEEYEKNEEEEEKKRKEIRKMKKEHKNERKRIDSENADDVIVRRSPSKKRKVIESSDEED